MFLVDTTGFKPDVRTDDRLERGSIPLLSRHRTSRDPIFIHSFLYIVRFFPKQFTFFLRELPSLKRC